MVEILVAPAAARFILRTAAPDMLRLPTTPCRAGVEAGRAALWLGPDEWLLIVADAAARSFRQEIAEAMAAQPYALIDVSHRQVALRLDGADAPAVLNASVPLDLSLSAFPVGMCTRTIFEKAEIVLWRVAATTWHLEAGRSYARYVSALLKLAAAIAEASR